jgi:hypothetical protein
MGKLKVSIEIDSFRSNGFLNTLKQICFNHDINLNISTTGWFYKTHFIKAEGDDNKVIALKKWIDETVELNQ